MAVGEELPAFSVRVMTRLDNYEDLPQGMRRYLNYNGWHFNQALCEWAVGKMKDRYGEKITPVDKQRVDELLKAAGVTLEHNELHDATYVWNMATADYLGSSLQDSNSVALFVKDYLDDYDGTPTRAMDEFVGRCIGAGCAIPWEDVL